MKNLRILAYLYWISHLYIAAILWEAPKLYQSGNTLQGKLVLTGSSTVAPLASEMAKRYEPEHQGYGLMCKRVALQRGIADARRSGRYWDGVAIAQKDERVCKRSPSPRMASVIVNSDNPV